MMEPLTAFIGAGIVGAFSLGLYVADRAYSRDRKAWQADRITKQTMIARQIDAIRELQYDKNELMDDNRALQAQNCRLANQRFALMNGQERAA
jgi:hypothetical protein